MTVRYTVNEVMADVTSVLADIDRRVSAMSANSPVEGEQLLAASGEVPVPVAEAEVEPLSVATERAEAEISSFMRVACATILPVFEQRGRWTRLVRSVGL